MKTRRILQLAASAALLGAVLSLWQLSARGVHASDQAELAETLQGAAAIAQLKEQGLYHSLAEAVAAANINAQPNSLIGQQTKLTANDGATEDFFGIAVAVSGNTAVVGASGDDAVATNQGSAYVFVRGAGGWMQQARLNAVDGAVNDFFGQAVAISGETVIIGANGDTVGANASQGSAYVFVRTGAVWSQQQKLIVPDGAASDFFGQAVAISGESVLVGANGDDIAANANQGSAYVFVRSGAVWSLQFKLTANDGGVNDGFGRSVALSGETALLGASGDTIGANSSQGSAYVFVRSGVVWNQQQKLADANGAAADFFGQAVSLSGETAVIGAPGDDIVGKADQGSAFVFARSGVTWTQASQLIAADGAAGDSLGRSVAISGSTVVAGSPNHNTNGNENQGAAYVFARNGATWNQESKLRQEDGGEDDSFGFSVALSGDTIVTGVAGDTVGVNAQQGSAGVFVVSSGLAQQQILTAADGAAGDEFGVAVAISGNTAVIGAFKDDISGKVSQGSAYVLVRTGAAWALQAKLTAADGAANDFFGNSVAISGDTVIVGAFSDDVDEANQGSAYIYVRSGVTWNLQQKLVRNNGEAEDHFGSSVAISGNLAVIGVESEDVGADDNQGAARVFVRNGVTWFPDALLTASDGATNDFFGQAVTISGETVVVGVPGAGSGGAAYVFVRNTFWFQQQKLTPVDNASNDFFGKSVALDGDTVIVGASEDDINLNGNQGSAYVFVRNGVVWSQQTKLTAVDGAVDDRFGVSVGLSGDLAVVGSHLDNILAGDEGSAHVFVRSGTTWSTQQKLTAAVLGLNDHLGASVAISGTTVIAGANQDDVNGIVDQGSAYIFAASACPAITLLPATLPGGAVGDSYSQTISGSGGQAPYDFAVTSGTLPPGLTLSATGLLLGTPAAPGTFTFTITATSSSLCTGSRAYTVMVTGNCQSVTVNPANAVLPVGVAGQAYSQTFTGSGGTPGYSFVVSGGLLPNGLTLSAGGVLSGAPISFGNFNFTVQATDNNGCVGARAYTLTINPPCAAITVNPASVPAGALGAAYNQTITATGGIPAYTFTVSAGALPSGLSLSAAGVLSGLPVSGGNFNFTIEAKDNNGCIGVRAYSVTINGGVANNGLQFYPLSKPIRLLDTRAGQSGCDAPSAAIPGQTSRSQTIAGRTCDGVLIPATAKAVTGNITTVQSGGGYLTLYPSDAAQPLVSNSNYNPNEILNNVFTVGLGAGDGAFKIFVTTDTHIVVDVTGYYAPPEAAIPGGLYFHPLPKPIRLLETRAGFTGCDAPGAPISGGGGGIRNQQARISCDGVTIPANAEAITGNATVVNPSGPGAGYLTLWPSDAAQPLVANSNFTPGQVLNAPFTVGLGADGAFKIFSTATTELVVDVLGYYSPDASDGNGQGLLFNPLPQPVRLLETRAGLTGCYTPNAPLLTASIRQQQARGICGGATVANNALAIVGNATVVNASAGYLTFWPSGAVQPLVATSNFNAGQVLNRHFTVGLGATGIFSIFASAQTDLVIDVSGFFAP